MLGIDQSQFDHKLTPVADAKAERVTSLVEIFQRDTRLFIVFKCAGPSFCRAKHIRIGETAHKNDQVYRFERLATRDQVCHVNILHVQACQKHHVRHFPVAVHSLFPDDGSLDATRFPTFQVDPQITGPTRKMVKVVVKGIMPVIFKTLKGQFPSTLFPVEQIGCFEPQCPQ